MVRFSDLHPLHLSQINLNFQNDSLNLINCEESPLDGNGAETAAELSRNSIDALGGSAKTKTEN
jgi:hypothetical protein